MNKFTINLTRIIFIPIGAGMTHVSFFKNPNDNIFYKAPQFNWSETKSWMFNFQSDLKSFINRTVLFDGDCVLKNFRPFTEYPLFCNKKVIENPRIIFTERHHWYCYEVVTRAVKPVVLWYLILYSH